MIRESNVWSAGISAYVVMRTRPFSLLPESRHHWRAGNDSFVVIEAVEDATVELSLRLREAEILEKCMSRTHRHIQRSLTAIKMFTGLIEEKVRDLTEDQIRQIPIANVNIFEGGFLRIVNVRHRDGEAILQDGFADIPERPPESSSSEEE